MINSVPFFRPSIGAREIEAVTASLRSGWLTTGPAAKAFEAEFCLKIGGARVAAGLHAIAVNSATAALHLGLEALGIGPGDEVIVPTLTFTATAEVVRYLGAKPILVDIDPDTLCIDPIAVEAAITDATKAIMPVHFAGRPCDMTRLRTIANQHGLFILDDAAHALPAHHAGQPIGTAFADATAFAHDLSRWNLSSVQQADGMFLNATSFNSDLSSWCLPLVPAMPADFDIGATAWVLPRPNFGECATVRRTTP